MTVFTISCGDDDEKDTSPLVGTWALSKDVYSGCDDDTNNSIELYTCTESECSTITFDAAGNVKLMGKSEGVEVTVSGKYTVSGSNVTLSDGQDSQTLEYNVSGATLTLDYGTDSFDGCENVETYTKK